MSKTDPIVEDVVKQFRERSQIGIEKYGTTLDRNDLSFLEWIQNFQEELCDAILYVEKIKQEINKN